MDITSTEIWKTIEPTSDGRGYYQVNQFAKYVKLQKYLSLKKTMVILHVTSIGRINMCTD